MKRLGSRGFTIIELLIATVVFSLILLIVTTAIIQISSIYYKGVTNAKTREVARSVIDEMAKQIQYAKDSPTSVGGIPGTSGARCVGGVLYKYRLMQSVSGSNHALVTNPRCSGSTLSGLFVPSDGDKELLGDSMHLRSLNIPTTPPYAMSIVIGYGSPTEITASNTCTFTIRQGGQFCAVAEYNTIVTKRR